MSFFDRFKIKKKAVDELAVRDHSRAQKLSAKVAENKPTASEPTDGSVAPVQRERRGAAYRVLIRPLVSEKAASAERRGAYTFMVASAATKNEVAEAILAVYGVRPVAVNTVQMTGKQLRFGNRLGRRKNWKKAIVILPAGKTISIHEGV